ncbi:MAG: ANTAR domain-containing protein [Clostridia bacterium]|nr:ANTAR domain-containing protein [Clostridia bacterium]MBR3553969.1 ANTAR domain-containing protein [Clostridia bacterium]
MELQERVYSVLVVSAAEKFNEALLPLLPSSGFAPVRMVTDISAAKRAFAERAFDFVIINAPLPDDMGLRFAVDVCAGNETVGLLMLREAFYAEVTERLTPYGVFTLLKPTSAGRMATALQWMATARERLRKTEKKTLTLQEKMEEIRLVNRAKWILIEHRGMDEPQAHRLIEKQAMDRCVTRRVIAQEIIDGG